MKTYKVSYTLEATIPVHADSPEHARWRFQEYTVDQLTSFAADSLKVVEVTEEKPLLPEVSNDLVRI